MGPRLPITTAFRFILAGAVLQLLGACATMPEPETGSGQKVGSAQILSICEKLSRSKDTRLAIGLCEKAHAEDPENPVPLLLLADMLQQQGALAQAGRAYGMAIGLDPDNVEAHYGLGKVFLARNQFELAIEQFEVARELNSRDHRLYNAIGVVLDNLGDHVGAQRHYRTGLELAPDNHALLKNLMLSRRLDESVTTPAIGPRHKVIPAPASEPRATPEGNTPSAAPGAAPSEAPAAQPRPGSGHLGHEPLARVPATPAPANGGDAQQLMQAEVAVPVKVTKVYETRAPSAAQHRREEPASSVREPASLEDNELAYYPIVLPPLEIAAVEPASLTGAMPVAPVAYDIDSLVETVWSTPASRSVEPVPAATVDVAVITEQTVATPPATPEITSPIAAAPITAGPRADSIADNGPEILASGLMVHEIEQEELAALDTGAAPAYSGGPGPADVATSTGPAVTQGSQTLNITPPAVRANEFDLAEAATAKSAMLVSSRLSAVTTASEAVAKEQAQELPAKAGRPSARRFSREHEEDHETRRVEGEIWDLVDVVNPLQHLPVVASIYRDITEDEIKPAARIAGGTLFGGILGFATSLVDSVVEEASGRDIGETTIAVLRRNSGAGDADEAGRSESPQTALARIPVFSGDEYSLRPVARSGD